MALDYGLQELNRHIPRLAKEFQDYADSKFVDVSSLSQHIKMAITEEHVSRNFRIELTERSMERFAKFASKYLEEIGA